MPQTEIPFLFMRGGTSRGPVFNRADLPEDREQLARVLIAAVGAGHPLNIDGIGGGAAVTTKVVMLSPLPVKPIENFFADCAEVLIPELNYEGQFANLVASAVPRQVTRLNRVPGVPMSAGDILDEIRRLADQARAVAAE